MGELGVKMKDGQYIFVPSLLSNTEFLTSEASARFILPDGSVVPISLEKNSLAFTVCQVPVVYKIAAESSIEVCLANGTQVKLTGSVVNKELTDKIIHRTDEVVQLNVFVSANQLR
jgi:hypothetical protein